MPCKYEPSHISSSEDVSSGLPAETMRNFYMMTTTHWSAGNFTCAISQFPESIFHFTFQAHRLAELLSSEWNKEREREKKLAQLQKNFMEILVWNLRRQKQKHWWNGRNRQKYLRDARTTACGMTIFLQLILSENLMYFFLKFCR